MALFLAAACADVRSLRAGPISRTPQNQSFVELGWAIIRWATTSAGERPDLTLKERDGGKGSDVAVGDPLASHG